MSDLGGGGQGTREGGGTRVMTVTITLHMVAMVHP